jgi:hypothetical protein
MNWLLRADVFVLGLLLVHTVAVIIRISHLVHNFRSHGDMDRTTRTKLAAKLNIQAGNLKAIASTAPYLGTVGTCLGILSAFTVSGEEQAALAIAARMAAALVPAAVGIIVAVPATGAYEYVRTRLDLLANELPDRKVLPTSWFTLPPFALIPAYALVILVKVWIVITPTSGSGPTMKGFDIGIASQRCDSSGLVLHLSDSGRVFLNQEELNGTLESRLSEVYTLREQRILYLLADEGVRFQTVADTIDTVEHASETVTSRRLNIRVRLVTPAVMNAPCRAPVPRKSPYP